MPADLGDSLLNMWIMAWVSESALAMLGGQMSFADLWNANIFSPTPLSLTFSDHLVPEALQGLPAYLATGNILLAYNLVFLATFALSGLGTFLFVRELTGSALAGFVAGLFYAFFPYRLNQSSHIQTLSSQWIPLALFGFRRYFDRGSRWALAGGAAAFVVQGLSTGYYLFFFAPVLAGYVIWELASRGRLRDWRRMGRGKRGRGGRARRHAAVPAAVRRGAGAVRLHPAVRRGAPLFRGPARLPQRALSPPFLGRAAHAVAAGRKATCSWARSRCCWPSRQ